MLAVELDLYRLPQLEEVLAKAIGADAKNGAPSLDRSQTQALPWLAVDPRSVTFSDSATLAMLLAASRQERARGAEFVILVGRRRRSRRLR